MNTIESWDNFTRYYGGIVGARDCFELACEDLLKKENPSSEVHRVKASRGDGGIDIYVSNDQLTQVYQCKFFIDTITKSRWNQIEQSFNSILNLTNIHVDEWYLCLPKEFTKEEIADIESFKIKHSNKGIKISFIDGNELVSRMKDINICEKWFAPASDRFLSQSAPLPCPEYIDRPEINALKDILLNKKHHLLISGIGGVGKTTLAQKLFDEIKMMYDMAIWMTYKENILSSVATTLTESNISEHIMILFEQKLKSKPHQRNLVFIDDVDYQFLSDKNRTILEQNSTIVITSRIESISGYITYQIEPFNDMECIKLFTQYYKRSICPSDKDLLIELMSRYNRNTLLIELIARAANKSPKTLNSFIECLLKLGISGTEIKVQNGKEKTYAKIVEHLAALYSLEELTDSKRQLLVNLSFSSERGVTEKFFEIIDAPEEDIGDLIEFGWIKRHAQGFRMHALVRECIRSQINAYDCYVPKLKSFYTDRDTYQSELSIIEKSMHFDIIIGLLKYITFKNIEDVYIFYNLIQLIDDFAYYKSLDNVVGLAIQELEKFDESELRAKIACDIFNAAGLAYLSFDKSKALLSFLCEEQLITKFFSSNERVKSVCYCNIGLVYTDIDFDKANHYFCKALEMEKRCFGEHSMEVADVYHNIGKNYLGVSDYPNASLYLEKALHIKRSANKYTYSLLKTEFGLANALNFMLKEPFVKEDIEKIRELYIAVLEGYKAMNNIHDHEYNNTLLIISAFLDKIGEHLQATKLKELLTCCVQSSPDNQAQ